MVNSKCEPEAQKNTRYNSNFVKYFHFKVPYVADEKTACAKHLLAALQANKLNGEADASEKKVRMGKLCFGER